MIRFSVTARIALLTIALALVSNLTVILFVWKQTQAAAIAGIRQDTSEQANELVGIFHASGMKALRAAIEDAHGSGDTTLVAELVDATGHRVTGTGPTLLRVSTLQPVPFRIARLGIEEPWVDHDAGFTIRRIGPYWLVYGRLLEVVEQEQQAVERALAVAVLVSLVLGIVGGLIVSRYVAGRLVRLARVVETVEAGDLTPRVPIVGDGDDAFDRLAVRLNAMLDKVERLMAELRVVTDSLAHDLRSPLARLRTKTENAVLIADPVAREAALSGLLVETDLVMRMLTMVIEISRAEQVTRDRFVVMAPGDLIDEIGELYGPLAEEEGIAFSVIHDARPAPISIHRELLTQAITNLIDNAIRHGGAAGTITLRLAERMGAVSIQVEDRGAGIAADDRATALKRFGRLDSARSTPGAGLGMALVEAVARLHGGRFELDDNMPGLIARIVLPRD